MNKLFNVLFLIISTVCFSQIIKSEEIEYSQDYKNKTYSTYHYVDAEYSMRSLQIFIVENKVFEKIRLKIPRIIKKSPEQDFSDFYILGISDFNKNKISEIDKEIISKFIDSIKKYREFYSLSPIDNDEFTNKNIIRYINNEEDLCLFMICKVEKNIKNK